MYEIDEPSKAVAETAKFGTASVGAIEKFGSFLSKLVDEPITDVVGYFGDKLKFIRWKNKLMIMDPTFRRCPQENNIFLAIVFGYLLKSLKLLSQRSFRK